VKNINLTLLNRPKFETESLTLYEKHLKPEAFIRKYFTWGLSRTTEEDYEITRSCKIPGRSYTIPVKFLCDEDTYNKLLKTVNDLTKIKELEVEYGNSIFNLEGVFVSELCKEDNKFSGILIYDHIGNMYEK